MDTLSPHRRNGSLLPHSLQAISILFISTLPSPILRHTTLLGTTHGLWLSAATCYDDLVESLCKSLDFVSLITIDIYFLAKLILWIWFLLVTDYSHLPHSQVHFQSHFQPSFHHPIAFIVTEKAAFEGTRLKGFVPKDCAFTHHLLVASIADVLPISSLVDIVLYWGSMMLLSGI